MLFRNLALVIFSYYKQQLETTCIVNQNKQRLTCESRARAASHEQSVPAGRILVKRRKSPLDFALINVSLLAGQPLCLSTFLVSLSQKLRSTGKTPPILSVPGQAFCLCPRGALRLVSHVHCISSEISLGSS